MRKLVFLIIVFVLSCMIIVPNDVVEGSYRLTVDDQLYISIWGHPDLQQEVVVGPDGRISFPLIGEV